MQNTVRQLIKNKIQEIEKTSTKRSIPGKLSRWIKTKSNKDIYDSLINDQNNFGNDFLQRLYNIKYDVKDWPSCKICENSVNEFLGYNDGYKETCCKKCTNLLKYGVEHPMKCKEVQDNLKKAMLEKYGVENAYQSDSIKEKIKEIHLKNYGVENPKQAKEIQERIKKTNLEKYGAESPLGSKQIREKIKQTNIEKYGAESPLGSKEIWDKIKKTNLERYGTEIICQSEEIKEKIKQISLEKYGVENIFQSEEIRKKMQKANLEKYGSKTPFESNEIFEKTRQTRIKKYGTEHFTHSRAFLNKQFQKFKETVKDFVIPLFDESEYEGLGSEKILKWKCAKCGNEFEQSLKNHHIIAKKGEYQYIPRCQKCFPHLTNTSLPENELYEFCRSLHSDTLKNNKDLIGIDLDIVIPSLKIALEFDGVYYHSTQFKKPGLHLEKTLKCNELGYRLIHIWEDEWADCKECIEERLIKAFNEVEEDDFHEEELILDRSWYNGIVFKKYEIIEEIQPKIIKRIKFDVEDCGELRIRRLPNA